MSRFVIIWLGNFNEMNQHGFFGWMMWRGYFEFGIWMRVCILAAFEFSGVKIYCAFNDFGKYFGPLSMMYVKWHEINSRSRNWPIDLHGNWEKIHEMKWKYELSLWTLHKARDHVTRWWWCLAPAMQVHGKKSKRGDRNAEIGLLIMVISLSVWKSGNWNASIRVNLAIFFFQNCMF